MAKKINLKQAAVRTVSRAAGGSIGGVVGGFVASMLPADMNPYVKASIVGGLGAVAPELAYAAGVKKDSTVSTFAESFSGAMCGVAGIMGYNAFVKPENNLAIKGVDTLQQIGATTEEYITPTYIDTINGSGEDVNGVGNAASLTQLS